MAESTSARRRRVRLEAIALLGGRCVGFTSLAEDGTPLCLPCRWHNEDGTVGCKDERGLTFDHKEGHGSKARKAGKDSQMMIAYEVKKGSTRFQLLCGTCHEIRKKVEKQAQGSRMHEHPERIRYGPRSRPAEGQHPAEDS